MKGFSILCLLLVFLGITSVCHANVADDTIRYNRLQIDSIVAVEVQRQVEMFVKAEVTKQVDNELIDLKIDKAANDKLGTYITEQNNHLTLHDLFIGAIITILVTIAGIVVPLILNRDREKKVKELTDRLNDLIKDAEKSEETAKASARYAEFSVLLARAFANKTVSSQIGLFTEIIRDYKDDTFVSVAYNARGNIYFDKGNQDKAISDYRKAIELNPYFSVAYNNLGIVYSKNGDYDKAIKEYNKAIELNPDYADAYSNQGIAYSKKNEIDTAIENYNKAIELNSDNDSVYNNRGNAYFKKGEVDKAIEDYDKAIELNPDNDIAYNNRGNAYSKKGKRDKAEEDFKKAKELKNKG